MKGTPKILIWLLVSFQAFGFRVSPGKWNISKNEPTIWIKLCESPVRIEENDITGNDPLTGTTGLTITQVLQSVVDDYNAIPSSYLRLALYPTDPSNPGTPSSGDSTFTIAAAEKRTINICFNGTDPSAGLSGGHAQTKYLDSFIVGCDIHVRSENTKKANFLTHLITHELGHCFGLMHPQESTHSVMSYFNSSGVFLRLQPDDFAGITYRYPEEDSYAAEQSTLGLTGCTPR